MVALEAVLPPYSLMLNSPAISGSLATFGSESVMTTSGQLNATVSDYDQVLWPEASNSIQFLYILNVISSNFTGLQLALGGQMCDVNLAE